MKIKRKAILFGTILILSTCILKHHSSAQSQNPSKRAPISNDSSDIFLDTIDSADAEAIKNGYFQEARLDFDGDGKKEKLMILLYPFHENGTETIQNRLYISKKKSGGEITWQVYDPAADLKTGFSAYQNMVLTADGQRYDLGLQWHTDYGETDIKQADYDGDGQQEAAFFYPYGGGDGASNGLLVIDRDNNKSLFWTDLFPYQAWSDGSIEKQCRKLLNCSLDKKRIV